MRLCETYHVYNVKAENMLDRLKRLAGEIKARTYLYVMMGKMPTS
jgi:hypothetical protein